MHYSASRGENRSFFTSYVQRNCRMGGDVCSPILRCSASASNEAIFNSLDIAGTSMATARRLKHHVLISLWSWHYRAGKHALTERHNKQTISLPRSLRCAIDVRVVITT